ncbi:MAG: MBL fold metallo-hydrolase [Myxococcota bacterium]
MSSETRAVHTIDTHYAGEDRHTAAYLVVDGERAAFVETNTNAAVPRLLETLAAAGRAPEDVDYVIITHIHLDHAGGAGALLQQCPNATLLAHPRAAKHAIDPAKIIKGASAVYGAEAFAELYGTIVPAPAERVRAMEDGETLAWQGGTWTFLHTRGHANHHFCIHDDRADCIFTGDSFGLVYPDLQREGEAPFAVASTTPTDFDPVAARATLERLLAVGAGTVYPTHFDGWTDLEGIARTVDAQLVRYGALLDAADASGDEGEALDARCAEGAKAIFRDLLGEHGLDEPRTWELLRLDVELNGQGVAAAVRKARYKRSRA